MAKWFVAVRELRVPEPMAAPAQVEHSFLNEYSAKEFVCRLSKTRDLIAIACGPARSPPRFRRESRIMIRSAPIRVRVDGMPKLEWNNKTVPEEGAIVQALAADSRGQYLIPFPVVFRDDSWWNARTGAELDTFIVGWRPANKLK
jgi:hypothetical protein